MKVSHRWYSWVLLGAGVLMLLASALAQAQVPAPSNLRWDVAGIDFGIQAAGTPSEVRTATLTNTGTSQALTSPIKSANTQFQVVGHSCPEYLAAQASCQVQVQFVPSAAFTGQSVYGVIVVGAYFEQIQLPLIGIVESPQGLGHIQVSHGGAGSVRIVSFPSGVDCVIPLSPCIGQLPIGANAVLHLTPRYGTAFTGWAGPCSGTGTCTFTVPAGTTWVTANVIPAASPLQVAPTVVAFESRGTQTRALTLRNITTETVMVTGLGSNDARIHVAPACNTMAAGAACTLYVSYVPNGSAVEDAVVNIITDKGAFFVPVEVDTYDSLVTHFYRSILGREPDAAGADYWNGEARRLAGRTELVEVWATMATQFFRSPEYLARGRDFDAFLRDLYATFLGRTPAAAELDYWHGVLQQAPIMPRQSFITAFAFSPEFQALADDGYEARPEVNLVMDMYRGILRRLPDEYGLRHWVVQVRFAQCTGGAAVNETVDAMSRGFISSHEYQQAQIVHNAKYVDDLYDAFMRRAPDAGGYMYWLEEVNTGRRSREELRQAFQASPEFQARVQAVIAAGCHPWPGEI